MVESKKMPTKSAATRRATRYERRATNLNLRKITLKLCKTNPISKKPKSTQTLFRKELMKNYRLIRGEKTNPKQSQTNPNSERAKTNAYSFLQRTYDEILPFYRQKNKAKTNPNSKNAKMNINTVYRKDYENSPPWMPKKQTQSNQKTALGCSECNILLRKPLKLFDYKGLQELGDTGLEPVASCV
jgi:hypothetical protein